MPERGLAHRNEPAASKKPKTVISTSAMFKRLPLPAGKAPTAARVLKPIIGVAKTPTRAAGITKAAQKPYVTSILKKRGEARRSEQHPLAVAFKETTTTYRTTLHSGTITALYGTHSSLRAHLHASASITLPSGESMLFQTAHAAAADDLALTLGEVGLEVWNADAEGNRFLSTTTLQARMEAFRRMMQEEELEIERLRREHESVVVELYWVAVAALGEEIAREMFGVVEGVDLDLGDQEEMMVGSEQDDSERVVGVVWEKRGKSEKRGAMVPSKIPSPSRYDQLDPSPSLPRKQITALKQQVRDISTKALEDLGEEEKEREKQWKVKQKKIVELLQMD